MGIIDPVVPDPILPGAPAPYPRIELSELFQIAQHPDSIAWTPFRPGVEIHRLYGDGRSGPTAALLRFRSAAEIPLHRHVGFEHILVLAGSQRDQNGLAGPGTLVINPPGTVHRVEAEAGCLVLAIYEKPVEFLDVSVPLSVPPPS